MAMLSKLAGTGAIAAAVLGLAGATDVGFNQARVLGALTGRAELERACVPELAKGLAERGFAPTDVELSPRGGEVLAFWRRSLAAHFTFQDGAAATRVDGVMACVKDGAEVRVEFRTSLRPVRTTSYPGSKRAAWSKKIAVRSEKIS